MLLAAVAVATAAATATGMLLAGPCLAREVGKGRKEAYHVKGTRYGTVIQDNFGAPLVSTATPLFQQPLGFPSGTGFDRGGRGKTSWPNPGASDMLVNITSARFTHRLSVLLFYYVAAVLVEPNSRTSGRGGVGGSALLIQN